MHTDPIHFPVLVTFSIPQKRKTKKKNTNTKGKKYQVYFVLPIYSPKHGQTPSVQILKENHVLPHPYDFRIHQL